MKTMMSCAVIVILALCLNTEAWAQESKEAEIDSMSKTVTINVPSIICGSCVKTVTNALKDLEGIKEVNIDKKTKIAVVTYDASKLKVTDIETAISKSGYDANEVKRDKKVYDQLDACCK